MFHVLDQADIVYSGDLSQATRYVIERYGKKLDEAIRSGIKILYSDAWHRLDEVQQSPSDKRYREPIDDWLID